MAKYCEKCKQPYPDTLAACPKCEPAGLFDPLETTAQKSKPGESPMLSRPQPQQPAATGEPGKPTMMSGSAGGAQPTMIAGSGQAAPTQLAGSGGPAQPTMIAGGGQAVPTQLAGSGQAVPTQLAGSGQAQPTMLAGKGGQAQPTMLSKVGQPTQLAPQEMQPLDMPAEGGKGPAQPTMLHKGAQPTQLAKTGNPTTLAPPEQKPLALPPEGTDLPPGKTMLAKQAQATMLAKTAGQTQLAPPDQQGPMDLPPGSPKATMLGKSSTPTTLAPPDEGAMALPGAAPKATMLAKSPTPTTLAPPEEGAMQIPGGAAKTQLGKSSTPTTLAPPDEDAMALPGGPKKTMVARGGGPTILAPEDDVNADVGVARDMLEGGAVEMGAGAAGTMADSSTKYDTAPAAPAAKPRYGRRWLGGIILGGLLGAAAVVLMALFGVGGLNAPKAWKDALGLSSEGEGGQTPLQQAREHLMRGDFQKAIDATGSSGEPDMVAVRGEARWLLYVQDQQKAGGKLNAADDKAAKAKEELTSVKAKSPAATYWLAQMEETFKGPDEARKLYKEGADTWKDPMFEAALERIDVSGPAPKAPPRKAPPPDAAPEKDKKDKKGDDDARLPKDADPQAQAEALAFLMAALLQAEKGVGPAPAGGGKPADEAGYEFWKAMVAAKKGDYSAAEVALKKARELHEKNRFVRLRKQQNPGSDPTEAIFLRAVDDLMVYMKIREALDKDKLLAENNGNALAAVESALAARQKPNEALDNLLKAARAKLGLGEKAGPKELMDLIDKFAKMQKDFDTITEGLKSDKYIKEDEEIVKGVQDALKDAKNKAVVDKIAAQLKKAGVDDENVKDADKGVGIVIKQRDDAWTIIDKAGKALEENKYLDKNWKREDVLAGVMRAIDAGRSPLVSALARTVATLGKVGGDSGLAGVLTYDYASRLAAAEGRAARLTVLLGQVRTPQEMVVNYWLPLLDKREKNPEVLKGAGVDATRVLEDKGAPAVSKASARTVSGLVARNSGDFDKAREDLGEAVKAKKAATDKVWRPYAERTLEQLAKPSNYYLPTADRFVQAGDFPTALEVLNEAIAAFPKCGVCLGRRSVVQLDIAAANAKGRLTAKEVEKARQDADAAIAAGATGEGNYALGRIAEEMGNNRGAEEAYRRAVAAHPANDFAGSKYRIALGRVLLGGGPARAPAKEDKIPAPRKVGQLDNDMQQQLRKAIASKDAAVLFTLITVAALQPDEDPDANPDLDETIRLGNEAIKAGNPEGYLIVGLARARKGQWTRGLNVYVQGLRRLIKPEYAEGLFYIIDRHPSFQLPDALRNPDPATAEKFYALGLRNYFLGRYADAEEQLKEAYRNNNQDARYLYYLGLAELAQQGKRDRAWEHFRMARLLERANKPSPVNVKNSLERVQGAPRAALEEFRR